jgi:hypothetical protein
MIERYLNARPPPPDRWRDFLCYAKYAEAVFALAKLTCDRQTPGLIGSIKGVRKLDTEESPYTIEPLTRQPAAIIYARPSEQLRLSRNSDNGGVPALGSEYNVPLVSAIEANFGTTTIGRASSQPTQSCR